ncbi:hypothetical protein LguiA_026611 [Lonicera macranthoides]
MFPLLERIQLGGNQFTGPLPLSFSKATKLRYIDLAINNFTMQISIDFGRLQNLVGLSLGANNLGSGEPDEMNFISSLANCKNQIYGKIPSWIFDLVGLNQILLSNNEFNESIPTHIGNLWKAERLGLANNKLLGELPPSIGNLSILSKLDLSNNNLQATDGFSSKNLVGTGNFGTVYKGILNVERVVAVKVFNLQRQGASQSFVVECEALRNVRHRNILKIITSCSSIDFQGNEFKALVYEFMPNGSLDSWLHPSQEAECGPSERRTLKFQQRFKIAVDVACALEYLHHSYGSTIIHCDLKPNNILLDGDMVAHIGDFGQARLLLQNSDQSNTGGIRGTIGYTAPEYGMGSEMSTKGDVYSYGILILDMITGKRPTNPLFVEGLNLHNYAKLSLPNRVMEIVDPMLLNNIEDNASTIAANDDQIHLASNGNIEEYLISMVKLGVACSMESTQDRMDIKSVVRELDSIKKTPCSDVTRTQTANSEHWMDAKSVLAS